MTTALRPQFAFTIPAAALLLTAAPALAGIIGTIGNVAQLPLPSSLAVDAIESNTAALIAFESSQTLSAALAVDATTTGLFDAPADLTPGTIPAGTSIFSYMLHADPVGDGPETYEGSIRFDEPVIGLVVTSASLVALDPVLGNPGTTYSTNPARGLELSANADSVALSISPDRRIVTFRFRTTGAIDEVRIITIPTPAATLALAPLALLTRRRR